MYLRRKREHPKRVYFYGLDEAYKLVHFISVLKRNFRSGISGQLAKPCDMIFRMSDMYSPLTAAH